MKLMHSKIGMTRLMKRLFCGAQVKWVHEYFMEEAYDMGHLTRYLHCVGERTKGCSYSSRKYWLGGERRHDDSGKMHFGQVNAPWYAR